LIKGTPQLSLPRADWNARLQQANELFTGPEQNEVKRLGRMGAHDAATVR